MLEKLVDYSDLLVNFLFILYMVIILPPVIRKLKG